MSSWSRGLAALFAVLALLPVPALAATKPVPPLRVPLPRPTPLRTVDHPPAYLIGSFDNGDRGGAKVALTFDADMTPGMLWQLQHGQVASWYNAEVVDILRSEGVPATLFLTGLWAETYPDVARQLAADPLFEIGSHTYDHAAFRLPCYGLGGTLDRGGEIARAQEVLAGITGQTPKLLRFPGDCYTGEDVELAGQIGLRVISGDVRSGDGFNASAGAIVATVLNQVRGGSIVLMHLHGGPNAPNTAPALRQAIPALRAMGYQLVTVSDLLDLNAPPSPPAPDPPAYASPADDYGAWVDRRSENYPFAY